VSFARCVLAATLVLAAGTGCSDDGDQDSAAGSTGAASASATTQTAITSQSDPRPEPPADQSRWSKQVDTACKPWQERIDALAPPASATELERWLGDLLPLVRKQVRAVAAIKPPAKPSEAKKAALFVESITKLERSLTRYDAAITAGDTDAIQRSLQDANAAGAAARGYAVSLDVTQCGGYSGG
jgi:hypothetical protein